MNMSPSLRSNRLRHLHRCFSLYLFTFMLSSFSYAQVGELLWEENFDTINPTIWNVIEGDGCPGLCGWGNGELQWYDNNNAFTENGHLVLNAAYEPGSAGGHNGKGYTSGRLDTQNKMSVQYGMIEVKMQTPEMDIGLWPAAWLLGTSPETWPRKGEIDIMEMGHRRQALIDAGHSNTSLNNFVGSNAIFWHPDACVPGNPTCAAHTSYQRDHTYVASRSLANRFVSYRLYWTDAQLRFTILDDGRETLIHESGIGSGMEAFQKPFYMLLNLAVGGFFTDALNNQQVRAPLPSRVLVDHIRIYKYNGQGKVTLENPASPAPEAETFGVFTDNTATTNKLEAGITSDIFVWNTNSVNVGNYSPYEGNNVIAWRYFAPNNWFGGSIDTRSVANMSNFGNGNISFNIRIPADISFRIGIADTYGNESWIPFNAGESRYGLVRNGDWGQVTIPVADIRGRLIALQSMKSLFRIASVDGQFPNRSFQFAIDNVLWKETTTQVNDTDRDGIPDSVDQCSNTPNGNVVDERGCSVNSEPNPPSDNVTGINQTNRSSVLFFVNTPAWADVHYSINNSGQQNVRMIQNNGRNTFAVNGLVPGDSITYNFTYWDVDHAVDTSIQRYELNDTSIPTPTVVPTPVPTPTPTLFPTPNPTGTPAPTLTPSPTHSPTPVPTSTPTPGNIVPLFDRTTELEPAIQFDRGDALVTRFSDRGRDRHAKEDQFQAYDHYLTFYWEHRTAAIEIVDYVAKGGDSIRMNVVTQWRLDDTEAENRWFYRGVNTVAEYYDNGTMERIDDFHYYKERSWNVRENRPIQRGDKIEFELSQFLTNNLPRGRANYYGTTYLYIVGEGLVPWDTNEGFIQGGPFHQEDSFKINEAAWLGGNTTLPYMHTNEPDNHFMQMATNLGHDNGQPFVKGRRIHHTSFVDGSHDENRENGIFGETVGKAGNHYINQRCSDCHERNGRAAPATEGESLNKWVFKVGDAQGNADPNIGRVLQSKSSNGAASEGEVSIAFWSSLNGLRVPNYQFSNGTPATFSARIAPQLVGLGLLEAIPESTILAMEDISDRNGDGISGKAQRSIDPITGDTRLGRFGWKAATSSLKHQIAAAFNTDMGVMTSVLPSPDCGSNQTDCGNSGSELSNENLDNLVKYIALLGVRPQRNVNDTQVNNGKALFSDIGCTSCHSPTLQTSNYHPFAELRNQTIHPYSDLLLHDMGEGLADNLGEGLASGAEWRTTPLWGLGLSACVTGGVTNPTGRQGDEVCTPTHSYLHDGRARSIEEAILWHGGEAQQSKQKYENLQATQKQNVLRFLESL